MSHTDYRTPDYLFETGWRYAIKLEASTPSYPLKVYTLTERLFDHYITIGPRLGLVTTRAQNLEFFEEDAALFAQWRACATLIDGGLRIRVRAVEERVEGRPIVILVDFTGHTYPRKTTF